MLKDLIKQTRSTRRFEQHAPVSGDTLRELVDCARLSASGRNLQPLKYYLSHTPERNAQIFSTTAWAGYLPDWGGPVEGERPAAYIIILGDRQIALSFGIDPGIAAQSILLAAREQGLSGCILGSVQRETLVEALNIPDRYEVIVVIALGAPKETVVLEPLPASGDIKYWRSADGVHHVPKRALDDVILSD
jgi:nitroreductase